MQELKPETLKPGGLATAIGSMPHLNATEAISLVLSTLKDIPVWPQLPHRSFFENMYVQYCEGFPGIVLEDERIYVDRSKDFSDQLERLYTAYLDNDLDGYAFGPGYAPGFDLFRERITGDCFAVKGQITGPISFGLVVTDENRRPILYDETLADAVAKHLRLKAAWQERELAKISQNTIMFIDEPYLTSLGSAYVALSEDTVITLVNEVLGGVNGLKGIHCCGNTDWSVLLKSDIDILNFDAYNFGEALALYPKDLKHFVDRGGILAFGIIPTDEEILATQTVPGLLDRLEKLMQLLSSKGIRYDVIKEQCLITPSCGLASISEHASADILRLTCEVSLEFRREFRGLTI